MSYETAKTVKTIVGKLEKGGYLLPLLQRDYVWKQDQVCKLFDSLLRNYPINTFTFWECKEDVLSTGYKFFNFEPNYIQGSSISDNPANIGDKDTVMSVIDGQQRLLSLYIGLRGSYTQKGVEKYLYLNINKTSDTGSSLDMKYIFKFKTRKEVERLNSRGRKKGIDGEHWFKVSDIIDFEDVTYVRKYIKDNTNLGSDNDKAYNILNNLYNAICKDGKISYYIETNQSLDEVTDIFIRMNNCGTPLKKSELFLSMAMLQWDDLELKSKLLALVNSINAKGDFKVTTSFVLQSAVILSTSAVKLNGQSLNATTLSKIKENWCRVEESLLLSFDIIAKRGYTHLTVGTYDLVLPIAMYIYENNICASYFGTEDGEYNAILMIEWFARSIFKKININVYFHVLRKIIRENIDNFFPLDIIKEVSKGTHIDINIVEEDINNVLQLDDRKINLKLIYSLLKLLSIDGCSCLSTIYDKKDILNSCKNSSDSELYISLSKGISNYYLEDIATVRARGDYSLNNWLLKTYPKKIDRLNYLKSIGVNSEDVSLANYKSVLTNREMYLKALFYDTLVD